MNNEWRKSSYSGSTGGNCVEVGGQDAVLVRDTMDRGGAVLTVAPGAWDAFLSTLR